MQFDNTEVAFKHKSNTELKQAKWLFSMFNKPFLVKYGPSATAFALRIGLPVKSMVKNTIFRHFCGGESIDDCGKTADMLHKRGVGSILDYSVEGVEDEKTFEANVKEIERTILEAKEEAKYPFAVFKVTGIARFELLQRASKYDLSAKENEELNEVKSRIDYLCNVAVENQVRLFIDAEETWIQDNIDDMVFEMMKKYNSSHAWIYNTLQMYRVDRIEYLSKRIAEAKELNIKLGYKLVRGAYMEKERERAKEHGYSDPIQPSKQATDDNFDAALNMCFDERDLVSICLGTHNEKSSALLASKINEVGLPLNDERFYFAQLFGMSDNISFNLAEKGYNVAKYLPYGPVRSVLPYLGRRAEENSSVAGQVGREMSLIVNELKRRKAL